MGVLSFNLVLVGSLMVCSSLFGEWTSRAQRMRDWLSFVGCCMILAGLLIYP